MRNENEQGRNGGGVKAAIRVIAAMVLAATVATPAGAVIEAITPLKQIIDDSDQIVVAKVERVEPTKSVALLAFSDDLKGKAESRKMLLAIRSEKEKENQQLFDRLSPGLPVVLFLTKLDDKQIVLAYTNGTWFQVAGVGEPVRWSFAHFEIYLRRTFKGTTAEMQDVVAKTLAGKTKPPAPNRKEPPGIGPEAKSGGSAKE